MFPIGLIGSSFFGWNMMLTCRYLRMNRNDAFSALRIGAFNNFKRMKITENAIKFFVARFGNQKQIVKIGSRDQKWDPRKPISKNQGFFLLNRHLSLILSSNLNCGSIMREPNSAEVESR